MAVEHAHGSGLAGGELAFVGAAELDDQRGRLGRQLAPVLGAAVEVPRGGDQRRGDHQLGRARAGGDERGHGSGSVVDVREVHPRERRARGLGARAQHCLGDERECPLRADDEPAEDLKRRFAVEQRAQAVAGDVLDLVLAPHALGERPIGEQLGAQLEQPLRELGLGGDEALLGVGRGGIDHGAGGEHKRQRLDGRVGVPLHAAAHTA